MKDERRPDARMFHGGGPPAWALVRPKSLTQAAYDLVGAALRMIVLPDHVNERLHLTSLRAERLAAVLPLLRGRVLDVGAGDNTLLRALLSTVCRHKSGGSRAGERWPRRIRLGRRLHDR